MSLIQCPECGSKISNKARTCPYCGFVSDDSTRPISEQDKYEVVPIFQYEIEEWNPKNESVIILSDEDNKQLVQYFGNWDRIKFNFPDIAEIIKKMISRDKVLVAEIDSYVKGLIDKGIYKFSLDKNGEILPTIREGSTTIKKMVRLKEVKVTPELERPLSNLSTNAMMIRILDKIEYVGNVIKEIQIEMQNDRLAIVEGSRDKLLQARKIKDTKLRGIVILNVINSATDGKRILMKNFSRNLEYVKSNPQKSLIHSIINSNKEKDVDEKSANSFQALVSITNAIQLECEGYAMLGEYEAGRECLNQFRKFIIDNKLNERDTLLLFNENLKNKQGNIVNEFTNIAEGIADIDKNMQIKSYINESLIESEVISDEKVLEE